MIACEKRVKYRVIGPIGEVARIALKDIWFVPEEVLQRFHERTADAVVARRVVRIRGTPIRAVQSGSATVAAFSSMSARRIAVGGHQNEYRSLSWKHAIGASEPVR